MLAFDYVNAENVYAIEELQQWARRMLERMLVRCKVNKREYICMYIYIGLN